MVRTSKNGSSPFHKYFCYYNKNKDIYQEDHEKRKRKHDEAGKQKNGNAGTVWRSMKK